MSRTITASSLLFCLLILMAGSALLPPARSDGPVVERSLAEFLAAQGTFCVSDGMGGCLLFNPPLPNMLVWSDSERNRCALVDYAGLAAKYVHDASGGTVDLGTSFSGSVRERELSDGRAEITITLFTSNALSWVVSGECDLANGPLLYGSRATEVAQGATASLSSSSLYIRLINLAPGLVLPDLFQIAFIRLVGQEFEELAFDSRGTGLLKPAFGVADGTPGRLVIAQVGVFVDVPLGPLPRPAANVLLQAT